VHGALALRGASVHLGRCELDVGLVEELELREVEVVVHAAASWAA
jgi:hypothetical protein